MKPSVTDETGWDSLWKVNMAGYIQGAPRTGVFVHRLLPHARTYLELGAGSARDSFYLSQLGKVVTASDFSAEAVAAWGSVYPPSFTGRQIDAFKIAAPDAAFDVTFHNGLYVLFTDEQILQMLVEQRRVSGQAMVIITHNRLNPRMVQSAERQSELNPLFRIRFFGRDEVAELVTRSGIKYRKMEVKKFGGPSDRVYRLLKTDAFSTARSKLLGGLAAQLYPLGPWSHVERVATVIYL
jgi:SAM-dependent methyltransferase